MFLLLKLAVCYNLPEKSIGYRGTTRRVLPNASLAKTLFNHTFLS